MANAFYRTQENNALGSLNYEILNSDHNQRRPFIESDGELEKRTRPCSIIYARVQTSRSVNNMISVTFIFKSMVFLDSVRS